MMLSGTQEEQQGFIEHIVFTKALKGIQIYHVISYLSYIPISGIYPRLVL